MPNNDKWSVSRLLASFQRSMGLICALSPQPCQGRIYYSPSQHPEYPWEIEFPDGGKQSWSNSAEVAYSLRLYRREVLRERRFAKAAKS